MTGAVDGDPYRYDLPSRPGTRWPPAGSGPAMMWGVICFVYRSPYAGRLGKHVRWLPDTSVLDWFRRGWEQAREDPAGWVGRELGADVHGLDSIFEKAVAYRLPAPKTWQHLGKLLKRYLYAEGEARVDAVSVRVATDDGEVPLAYYFLDGEVVRRRPDRLAYLVHEDLPLPASDGVARPGAGAGWSPPGEIFPGGSAGPATYVVVSTVDGDVEWESGHELFDLPGIRVPELAGYLRERDVDASWPVELVVLRAAVGEDDDLAGALDLVNRWAAFDDQGYDSDGLHGAYPSAHRMALRSVGTGEAVPGPLGPRRPDLGRIEVADHLVQACLHMGSEVGYQQLFVFDDQWAVDHPDLATSLLRYADHWDPLRSALRRTE